ncbi:Uncharacterized protein ALO59_03743 [Pseudomonas amygdali pv. mellea]|uniref:hypothetical protein n=1 Tax=Pseudomonas amygdali TaxID=47877 RepID=UPI0006E60657|nr:hypothetical protein [Pseudomonas amygdali]KPW38597.1 Uncharacterized protein ALO51_02673 [Pseudomonas amygdali]KPX78996.1 Uncharacterized protein ALO59_03743 [Pseudomonas amygdali pv. mellea]
MGEEKGNVLLAKAQRDTFRGSVKKLIAARSLPDDVTGRFEALVKERNWLVHTSLEENRKASINDGCFEAFLLRLEAMVNETNALMRELLVRAEEFVLRCAG